LNVDFDLTLTVCAHLLYQCLGRRLKGFETSTPQKLYRKFVNRPRLHKSFHKRPVEV